MRVFTQTILEFTLKRHKGWRRTSTRVWSVFTVSHTLMFGPVGTMDGVSTRCIYIILIALFCSFCVSVFKHVSSCAIV